MLRRKSLNQSSADAHAAGHHAHPHVTPLPVYFTVFGILLVLTVLTVVVSTLGLPPMASLIVAMAVALVKATLVAMYFMHLKYEDSFYTFIFAVSLVFVGLFFVGTLVDMRERTTISPDEANFGVEQNEGQFFIPNKK